MEAGSEKWATQVNVGDLWEFRHPLYASGLSVAADSLYGSDVGGVDVHFALRVFLAASDK